MLDQNTDRMWYVIGAIVIGAAIIAMGLNIFSESFDSVEENYANVISIADDSIDGIGYSQNLINPADLIPTSIYGSELVEYNELENEWTVNIKPRGNRPPWSTGLHVKPNRLYVPYGESLTISYEVYIPDHVDINDVFVGNDVNNGFIGVSNPTNDNDNSAKRIFNGSGSRVHGVDVGVWSRVWFSYTNDDSVKNPDGETLYDWSWFGVVNDSDEAIDIKFRKIKGELGDSPTKYVPYK